MDAPRIARCVSPRHARILLVAGSMPAGAGSAIDHIHDQISHPRATVSWDGRSDPWAAIETTWRALCSGDRDETDRLPDRPPRPWRGIGPHGQGGEGMTGGTPYGRPMAMRGDDPRDGLSLDLVQTPIGPFAPMLPPGIAMTVCFQGDLIARCTIDSAPFEQSIDDDAPQACAARLAAALGAARAARRLRAGRGPGTIGLGLALPAGLAVDRQGRDARTRLRAWLSGESANSGIDDLAAAITGLEWREAVCAINSLTIADLRNASPGRPR
ncbi:MAG: hypothetical protein R3E87_13480 [Burkholderiaceae bacterium]